MRTALALAVENPRVAVTFIPLGCSGATINAGFLNSQRARECPSPGTAAACSGTVRAQIAELTELLASARRHQTERSLDLVLLTIGANDILFSGLIANVMIEAGTERSLLSRAGIIASVEDAQTIFDRELPGNFAKARAVLKPLVGGSLSRVVFVTYGNPARARADETASTCILPSRWMAGGFVKRSNSCRRDFCPGLRRSRAAKTARAAAILRPSA
jgi:hypothetical protein